MTALTNATATPPVSVIVPARNEEVCLGACLHSLLAQTGVDFEIIVVDDGSTDRTREIAASLAGVRVIDAGPLPEGCSGKCNAAQAGANVARGEWLLFTDADTVHLPRCRVARKSGARMASSRSAAVAGSGVRSGIGRLRPALS